MSIKQKVFHSIKWLGIGQAMSQVLRLAVTIYVIRLLDQSDLGLIALATAVVGFMEMFATLGLNASLIRKKDLSANDLGNVFGLLLALNIIIIALVNLAAPAVAEFYGRPELLLILRVLSVGFLFNALAAVPTVLLNRDMRFKAVSMIQLGASMCSAMVSFYLATHGYAYWALVIGGITIPIMLCVFKYIACPVWVLPRIAIKESIEHISFGGFITGAGIFWYLYVTLDVAIAGKFWSVELVGLYSVAIQLAVLPLNRILPILKQVAFPAFSKTFIEDERKLEHYLSKAFRLSMTIIIPLYIGMSSVAGLIVSVFLGEKWSGAAMAFSFLCFSAPFRFFIELFCPAVLATGNSKIVFQNELFNMVVMMVAFYLVVSNFSSPSSLASVWMFLYPLVALNMCRSLCKAINIPMVSLLKPLVAPALAALIMYWVVRVFISFFESVFADSMLLVGGISVGAVTYILVILVMDRTIFSEIKSLLLSRNG